MNLGIAAYVFSKRPNYRLNQVYGMLTIVGGVFWPFSEFLLRSTSDPDYALIFAKAAWTGVLFVPAIMLHLAYVMTKFKLGKSDKTLVTIIYVISGFFATSIFATNDMISGVKMAFWGYTGTFGFLIHAYSVFFVTLCGGSLLILYQRYRATDNSIERIQIKYVTIGISITFILCSLFQLYFPILGLPPIPIASVLTIVMDSFVAYAIVRYKFLLLNPAPEGESTSDPKFKVEAKTMFIMDQERERAFTIFCDQIMHGRPGLCATDRSPVELRANYGFTKTPIIWLTDQETEHRSIPPLDLKQLGMHMRDFIQKVGQGSIIILDGVDALIKLNGFKQTYECERESPPSLQAV